MSTLYFWSLWCFKINFFAKTRKILRDLKLICNWSKCKHQPYLLALVYVIVDFLHVSPECKCNGHAQSCHFDWTVWRESGQWSGGVCDCLHNTEGRQCQKCKAGFYRDPQRPHTAPDSCKRKTHKRRTPHILDMSLIATALQQNGREYGTVWLYCILV